MPPIDYDLIINCSIELKSTIGQVMSSEFYYSTAIIMFACSLASILASSLVLATFYHYQAFNILQIKIIATLTLFDVLWSGQNIVVPIALFSLQNTGFDAANHLIYCNILGWVAIFSIVGSVWWTSAICHQVLISLGPKRHSGNSYYPKYLSYGVITACVLALIPLFFGGYGPVGDYSQVNCFISPELPSSQYYFLLYACFFVPIWVSFCYNLYCIVRTIQWFRKNNVEQYIKKQTYYLFIYPTLTFICWIMPTVTDIIVPEKGQGSPLIVNISLGLSNSVGLFNAMAYSVSAVRHMVQSKKAIKQTSCGNHDRLTVDEIVMVLETDDESDATSFASLSINNQLIST